MPVREITDADLVRRAVMNARPRGMGGAPRWAAVMDTFALGSTYAWELCEATGFDPEAQVSGATCPRCEENADDEECHDCGEDTCVCDH